MLCRAAEQQERHQEPAGYTVRPTVQEAQSAVVVYPKGPITGLPDAHASRRERFAELDDLQPGWQVELRSRGAGGAVDAAFFSPTGKSTVMQPRSRSPIHFRSSWGH